MIVLNVIQIKFINLYIRVVCQVSYCYRMSFFLFLFIYVINIQYVHIYNYIIRLRKTVLVA